MDIKKKLCNFMRIEFKEYGFHENFSNDSSLFDEGILDSMSILILINFLDEEFGILPEEGLFEPEEIRTVNNIAKYVLKMQKTKCTTA